MISYKNFNVKNITQFIKGQQYQTNDALAKSVSNQFQNVIAKTIEGTSLLHIQFGHPLKLQANKSAQMINLNINKYKPEVNTIIFDIAQNKSLTTFDILIPISSHNASKQIIVDEINSIKPRNSNYQQDNNKAAKQDGSTSNSASQGDNDTKQQVKSGSLQPRTFKVNLQAYCIPHGITIKCYYHSDQWLISTFTNPRMNEANFGGNTTLYQLVEQLLNKFNLSFDKLQKENVYTFQLELPQFTQMPDSRSKLWIYDIQRAYTGSSQYKDRLYNVLDQLTVFQIPIFDVSNPKFIKNILFGNKSELNKPRNMLMQSIIIFVNNKQYELFTSVKELTIDFNVFRTAHPDNLNTQELLVQFVTERLSNGHSNQFIDNNLTELVYQPLFEKIHKKYVKDMTKEDLKQSQWEETLVSIALDFIKQIHYKFMYKLNFEDKHSTESQLDQLLLPRIKNLTTYVETEDSNYHPVSLIYDYKLLLNKLNQ